MAIAASRPQQTEAPTQETGTLPRLEEQERRRVSLTLPRIAPGRYLALEDGEDIMLFMLGTDNMHIGRSPAADIVLDDASVSRRHALVTKRGETTVILDDRSLNGVFVNGKRVEWQTLEDGDEVVVTGEHAGERLGSSGDQVLRGAVAEHDLLQALGPFGDRDQHVGNARQ